MPELALATTTVRRARGQLPQLPLVNMRLERALSEPRQFSLLPVPGLVEEGTTLGGGPVKALFQRDGVISGHIAAVSGVSFYANGTEQGSIAGGLTPSMAGNEIGVAATAGTDGVFFNGATLATIDFPDGTWITKVIEQGGRFIALEAGTGRFFWTEVLSDALVGGVLTFDALNYATAESEPDALVDGVAFEDALAFGGTQSIEFWTKTGDEELPYTPSTGRVFTKGVRATGCMAAFDNTFAWVSRDNIVYRAGNVPERISDAGIEELIAASATCRVDGYYDEGHELLKIALDTVTVEYDAQTQQWAERKTGTGNFRGGPVVEGPIFGSTVDGALYEQEGHADLDGSHERSFCVFQPINGGTIPIDNVILRSNPGHTDFLTGDYVNPVVELIQSFDGGMTFVAALPEYLGAMGEYRREVEWRALGFADAPGFYARFRVTDPVSFRCSGVAINEPHGGRSR